MCKALKRFFCILTGTLVLTGCAGSSAFDPGPINDVNYSVRHSREGPPITVDGSEVAADQLLIWFHGATSEETIRAVLVKYRLRVLSFRLTYEGSKSYSVETPYQSDLSALRRKVASEPGVKEVYFNASVSIASAPLSP